ncbi:MAG: arginine repressor [Clostridiales bacterium]|jgi:transcriptional regulator of arginine metabolism|nr:arginine repressor [Clostridiales bacterium]
MKSQRHLAIIDIIDRYDIETQEELSKRLKEDGFNITQATVSRDIRELKLGKILTESGVQKYAVMPEGKEILTDRQKTVFREGVVKITNAGNILVIKTLTGMAMAVAASVDAMSIKDIVGTIAGDDTIFSVFKTEREVFSTIELLNKVLNL